MVSPTNVTGYGGRNGEIVITWTVSVHTLKHLLALKKDADCFLSPLPLLAC